MSFNSRNSSSETKRAGFFRVLQAILMGSTSEGSSNLLGAIGNGGTQNTTGASFQVGRAARANRERIRQLQDGYADANPIMQAAITRRIQALNQPTSGSEGLMIDSPFGPVLSDKAAQSGYSGNMRDFLNQQSFKADNAKFAKARRKREAATNARINSTPLQ